ncbi:hypothetical protein [Desulfosporosinus orientis]|uniref:hypothetical protein n=1 Tax=Desulfosporosinus orientis TaxID=1563 RepID=UPI0002FA2C55|nr:hypothetical protein [Desulfosporosinus orientis]
MNNLKKVYTTRFGGSPVQALANESFSVEQGEYVAIMVESDPAAVRFCSKRALWQVCLFFQYA